MFKMITTQGVLRGCSRAPQAVCTRLRASNSLSRVIRVADASLRKDSGQYSCRSCQILSIRNQTFVTGKPRGEPPGGSTGKKSNNVASGPPDTFIDTGYVVASDATHDEGELIEKLRETLKVQLLAVPKTSFIVAQSYVELAMAEHAAMKIQDAILHYKAALAIYCDLESRYSMLQRESSICSKTGPEHQYSNSEGEAEWRQNGNLAKLHQSKCQTYLGVVSRDWGDLKAAEDHLVASMQLKRELFSYNHPMMVDTLHNLACIRQMNGKYEEAIEHYEESIQCLLTSTNGSLQSPYMAMSYYNLGCCHIALNQTENAKIALNRGLNTARGVFGEDHDTTKRIEAMWTDLSK